MLQHSQEHPLILELLNLKKAISACPEGPERENALKRADLAIRYAESVIARYERGYIPPNTPVDTVKLPNRTVPKRLRALLGFAPRKK